MDTNQMLNIDPRLLSKLSQNPHFSITQSQETIGNVGYRNMSKHWDADMRVVYENVKSGYEDTSKPPITTNMSAERWQKAVEKLAGKGAIKVKAAPVEEVVE